MADLKITWIYCIGYKTSVFIQTFLLSPFPCKGRRERIKRKTNIYI